MTKVLNVTLALAGALVLAGAAAAQPACTITQITHSGNGNVSVAPSLDGDSIAFTSNADLAGENPDGKGEVFLFDGSTLTQITHTTDSVPFASSSSPSLDGGSIAFASRADLTGGNPDGSAEIFLFDGSTIRQITHATRGFSEWASLDDGSIAFVSSSDLTGGNPDGNQEIFFYNGFTITQITHATGDDSVTPSLDGGSIAFSSRANLTGDNPDGSAEIFLFNGATIRQITDSPSDLFSAFPSLDRGSIAFHSEADLTGGNPEHRVEIFLFDGTTITQITESIDGGSHFPSLDGGSIAFASGADLAGGNPDRNIEVFLYDGFTITQVSDFTDGHASFPRLQKGSIAFEQDQEIFLATCDVQIPAPPPGPYLTSDAIPGFRFKVRITSGAQVITGQRETDCIGETLCVSGALQGRSELFVRIIGPRPNGFLWLNLVRFTPSRVEVWAEQIATGKLNYYDLPALPSADTELTGKVDKEAFLP